MSQHPKAQKEDNLQLKKWDPSTISDHSVIVVIGKRGSGKSVILRSIMHAKRHIPLGICVSGTEEGNRAYSGSNGPIPAEFVFSEFNERAIERLVDRQKKLLNANKPVSSAFIILDDVMYDPKVMRTKIMRELFLNGRHFKLLLILSCQYLIDVPTYARGNTDWVVCLREPIISNRQKMYKFFGGVLPDYNRFASLLDQTTQNYESLVINQTGTSNSAEDVFYWYRAQFPLPVFRMGSAMYWRSAATIRSKRKQRSLKANSTDKLPRSVLNVKKI